MPASVAYAQQVPASYSTLSKRGAPVNESPFTSIEVAKPITERIHHLPQQSSH